MALRSSWGGGSCRQPSARSVGRNVTIQDLGSIGELVAAIATVATLAYLAVQIRQNNRALRATAYKDLLQSIVATREFISSTPGLADAWHSGLRDFESLSEADQYRFATALGRAIANLQIAIQFHELGILEREMLEPRQRAVLGLLSSPGGSAWWRTAQGAYDAPLRDRINAALGNDESAA